MKVGREWEWDRGKEESGEENKRKWDRCGGSFSLRYEILGFNPYYASFSGLFEFQKVWEKLDEIEGFLHLKWDKMNRIGGFW